MSKKFDYIVIHGNVEKEAHIDLRDNKDNFILLFKVNHIKYYLCCRCKCFCKREYIVSEKIVKQYTLNLKNLQTNEIYIKKIISNNIYNLINLPKGQYLIWINDCLQNTDKYVFNFYDQNVIKIDFVL